MSTKTKIIWQYYQINSFKSYLGKKKNLSSFGAWYIYKVSDMGVCCPELTFQGGKHLWRDRVLLRPLLIEKSPGEKWLTGTSLTQLHYVGGVRQAAQCLSSSHTWRITLFLCCACVRDFFVSYGPLRTPHGPPHHARKSNIAWWHCACGRMSQNRNAN